MQSLHPHEALNVHFLCQKENSRKGKDPFLLAILRVLPAGYFHGYVAWRVLLLESDGRCMAFSYSGTILFQQLISLKRGAS